MNRTMGPARAWLTAFAASLVLAGCASTPPEEDPVFLRLNNIDARLTKVETILGNQSLVELAAQLASLQADVRSIRGDLDQLQHSNEGGRSQQHDLYADLDKRIQALESGAGGSSGAAPGSAAGAGTGTGAGATDQGYYKTAFDLLKAGQYDKAITAFQQFLAAFPDSALADNAQYWLGEAYYVNKDFESALKSFRTVVERWPNSRKLADALLKIGYCNYELKRWAPAREALQQVTRNHADSPSARLAAERLDRMDKEGH
ncbi:MAG: tol-pal system protein YbgF [Steroidobacterales bacterium]